MAEGVTLGSNASEHLDVPREGHPILHRLLDELANLRGSIVELQRSEAKKQPDNYLTQGGPGAFVVPDLTQANGAVPVQLSGKKYNRNTIVISNTGSIACLIGNSESNVVSNGFTLAAGGVITIQTRQAVWAYIAGVTVAAGQTTLETLENLYGALEDFDHKER